MREREVDVAIRGAGPVGCALALALRDSGLVVRLSGRTPRTDQSLGPAALRPLALSYASRLILERLGAWKGLSPTPIETIHVSQAGSFGRTRITDKNVELPALGYVVRYEEIARQLAVLVGDDLLVDEADSPLRARLVVHAEGTPGDQAISKEYGHTALVASIESDRPSHGTAWERFTAEGPMALLPLEGHYGLVWSRTTATATALMGLGDGQFLAAVQNAFGHRAGSFRALGPRSATPLVLRYRPPGAVAGEVHVGNAAQSLHPVAGQGLNLGLRDAWDLAGLVRTASCDALGSLAFAREFAQMRRVDAKATILATDLMATLYVRPDPLAAALRGAALAALDLFPPARRQFARRMIFGPSAW